MSKTKLGGLSFAAFVAIGVIIIPLDSFAFSSPLKVFPASHQKLQRCRQQQQQQQQQMKVGAHSLAEDDQLGASSPSNQESPIWKTLQLVGFSFLLSILVISWEDLSMAHPLRQSISSEPLTSTVRGLAFGELERQKSNQLNEFESEQMQAIPSYNEVMLQHRTERVAVWNEKTAVTKLDVQQSVRTIQRSLLLLEECKALANDYEWESLLNKISQSPLFHSELEQACNTLQRATGFLSPEARAEVGFDWGRLVVY
jgi:hypothetical protein